MRLEERYYQLLSCTQYGKGKEFFFDIVYDGEQHNLNDHKKYIEVLNFIIDGITDDYKYVTTYTNKKGQRIQGRFAIIFRDVIQVISDLSIGDSMTETVVITQEDVKFVTQSPIVDVINHFMFHSLRTLKSLCDFQGENYVNLSIPDDYLGDTLNVLELMKDLNDFSNLFTKGFSAISPILNVTSFNKGSSWIEIFLSSNVAQSLTIPPILLAISKIAKSFAETRKLWLEGTLAKLEIKKKSLERLGHKDISVEKVKEHLEVELNVELEYEIEELYNKLFPNRSDDLRNEELPTIKQCVKKLAYMQHKGLIITPAFLENGNAELQSQIQSLELDMLPKKIEDQRE